MRVLHVAESFSQTSETFIYDLVTEVEKNGVENHVLTTKRVNEDDRPFPRVAVVPVPSETDTRRLLYFAGEKMGFLEQGGSFRKVLRERISPVVRDVAPDVVHAHFGPMGVLLSPVVEKEGIPFITTFYGYDISELLNQDIWVERYKSVLWPRISAATVLSEEMRQKIVEAGCPEDRVRTVHLSRNLETFPYRPSSRHLSTLLSVGRLVDKKGHRDALRVLHNVRGRGHDVSLHIVGGGPNEEELRALASEIDVSDHVVFHGKLPSEEVARLMEDADVFLLCSRTAPSGDREGTPTVLIEAQASGLPCVSTTHAGIPEMIPEENHHFLAPEGEVDALTDALLSLLGQSSDEIREIARRGRDHVAQEFNLSSESEKLRALYRSVQS